MTLHKQALQGLFMEWGAKVVSRYSVFSSGHGELAGYMTIITKLYIISAFLATIFLIIFLNNLFLLTFALQGSDVYIIDIIFALGLIGFSGWCLYISMSLIASLRKFIQGANILAEGNTNYTFDRKSQEEIGQLAHLLNKIISAFQQHSATLEQKIGKSARDLPSVNRGDDAMLANISDAVVATDEHGLIAIINNAALRALGLERKNVLGKKAIHVIPAQDEEGNSLPDDKRAISQVLATGHAVTTMINTAYYYVRSNNTRFPVAITATPTHFMFNGNMIRVIEIFRDVTKEKEIDRQKSEFISIASHQLRTPLGSMRWNLELMESEIVSLPPQTQARLQEIHAINLRVIYLVRDLLDVARIEQGRVEDNPERTDVASIVQSVIKEVEYQAREKSISLTMEIKKSNLPQIIIDAKRLREVIQNLLTNAIKYTLSDGCVRVVIDYTDISIDIAVSDTGIGIPEKDQSRIFSKFTRAENAAILDTEGIGLGLYIAKSYITQWGGKIWFTSKEGKGTTFYISLPLRAYS